MICIDRSLIGACGLQIGRVARHRACDERDTHGDREHEHNDHHEEADDHHGRPDAPAVLRPARTHGADAVERAGDKRAIAERLDNAVGDHGEDAGLRHG